MNASHEPTPEFARYLEWQVTTALRRQQRFSPPSRRSPVGGVRAVILVLVSILAGAAGVAAAGRIQEKQQKELLLTQQEGELRLAEMQLAVAEKAAKEAQQRVAVGLVQPQDLAAAEAELQRAALALQRIRVNLDEVRHSGRPVQDDVTSPLVDGQDFVKQRLELERQIAAVAAAAAEKQAREARRRHEVGLSSALEQQEVEAALVRATADLKKTAASLELRDRFVAGKLDAAQATHDRLLAVTRIELESSSTALQLANERLARLQALAKVGTVEEIEVLKAQLELLSRKQDVERLRAQLAALEKERPR